MTSHDDQQHAQRHDDDEGVLQDQVGDVDGAEQNAAGHELEEQHDDDEGDEQAVFPDIASEVIAKGWCGFLSAFFGGH